MLRKVTTLITAVALLAPAATHARYLSADEALRNVNTSSGIKRSIAATTDNYRLVYSATDSVTQQPTVYVFARTHGSGFIVAAASDLVTPLLGYSDTGTPYGASENPEFEYWLSCYTDAIVNAESNGTGPIPTAPAKASRSDIAPLVSARWNQSAPYNQDCPIVAGSRSVTGCVATAFAQVMYYHKWPKEAGTGSHSYTWTVNGTDYSESMDFSKITFDWANMTDTYSSSSTAAQKAAVAQLMHAVGVGAEMGYTPSASSAVTLRAARALLTYWNYDKGAVGMSRSSYSLDDWSDIIYAELAANRPVIYDGQSTGGGHCFICDGYQASTGYFHFNWGWGGHYDGYFVLTDLTPGKGGIGGTTSDDGYNTGQGIVAGLQPAIEGSDYHYSMSVGESLAPEAKVYDKLSWIRIPGKFQNTSLVDLTFATRPETHRPKQPVKCAICALYP